MTNKNIFKIMRDACDDVRDALNPYLCGQALTAEEKTSLIVQVACTILARLWARVKKDKREVFLERIRNILDSAAEALLKERHNHD